MDYKFVNDISEEYKCQVCMKLLDEPQLTDCCGQHFCRACLDQWFQKQGKKQCPHCRSETFSHISYLPLKRKINELNVYCSYREKGCGLILKLEELERHQSINNPTGCGYIPVKCSNLFCNETCLRKDFANHSNNTCLQRKVKCKYCGEIGRYAYITSAGRGHLAVCQEYLVNCPRRCDTIRDLKRKDLEAHKEVCPLEPVECPFREAGCKQELVRKDLDTHIQSSIQQHLMATNKTLMREYKEHQKLKSTVASVASELETMRATVKDRSVATLLGRITATLNQVSLRLEKEGDQVIFQFSSSLQNWTSPVFKVNDTRMSMAMNSPDTHSFSGLSKLSLLLLNGELDGKYQINIKLDLNTETQTDAPNSPSLSMPAYLCAKCKRLPKQKSSKESKPGQEIAHKDLLPPSTMSRRLPTCVVTLTLEKHNCIYDSVHD